MPTLGKARQLLRRHDHMYESYFMTVLHLLHDNARWHTYAIMATKIAKTHRKGESFRSTSDGLGLWKLELSTLTEIEWR